MMALDGTVCTPHISGVPFLTRCAFKGARLQSCVYATGVLCEECKTGDVVYASYFIVHVEYYIVL